MKKILAFLMAVSICGANSGAVQRVSAEIIEGDVMSSNIIGQRIKMLRKKAGLSADAVGEIIGKDRATVYRYENGDIGKMSCELLEPLAHAFSCTLADIIGTTATDEEIILTSKERKLVGAYRSKPEMQQAVDKLLELEE